MGSKYTCSFPIDGLDFVVYDWRNSCLWNTMLFPTWHHCQHNEKWEFINIRNSSVVNMINLIRNEWMSKFIYTFKIEWFLFKPQSWSVLICNVHWFLGIQDWVKVFYAQIWSVRYSNDYLILGIQYCICCFKHAFQWNTWF